MDLVQSLDVCIHLSKMILIYALKIYVSHSHFHGYFYLQVKIFVGICIYGLILFIAFQISLWK